jgi:hypothetical protein
MDVLCSGYGLVESPRWHEGRRWFIDWTGGQIVAVDDSGATEVILEHRSLPMCFDFLPDGRLVLVSNQENALLTLEADGTLATYADLRRLSGFGCNDIVVDGHGHAYVNSGNFDFATGPPPGDVQPGVVGVVRAGVAPRVVAEDIAFPNGMLVTADGSTWSSPTPTDTRSSGSRSRTTARSPSDGSGPTSASTTPTGSASTPTARPGTPTSRTSGASGSRRAAKCCRPSCWTEARLHARRHGRTVPLCRHGRLARGRRVDDAHRLGRPGRADPGRRARRGLVWGQPGLRPMTVGAS